MTGFSQSPVPWRQKREPLNGGRQSCPVRPPSHSPHRFCSKSNSRRRGLPRRSQGAYNYPVGKRSDDKQDLETIDAAISRVMEALEKGELDLEIRERLHEELAIFAAMRRKISGGAAGAP